MSENTIITDIKDAIGKSEVSFSVAESCTGGLLSHSITNIPGISRHFRFGAVTYTNDMKMRVLGVKEEILNTVGAVSEDTAMQMAEGVRELSESDIGVSTTGFAGPANPGDNHPVGTVFIGISTRQATISIKHSFGDISREEIKTKAAMEALRYLHREIVKY